MSLVLNLYIVSNGLSKMYLNDLKKATREKLNSHVKIHEKFNLNEIDIVVTQLDDYEKILKLLGVKNENNQLKFDVLSLNWLIESNKNECLLDRKKYVIKKVKANEVEHFEDALKPSLEYECQRVTKLNHYNHEFTDALEILEKHAQFRNTDNDKSRALAFRRSICVLRSLTKHLEGVNELKNFKNIGEHTRNVIKEIIDYGYSKEVESIVSQEYYKTMEMFNLLFGCGPTIANRLYENGYRSIDELRRDINDVLKYDHDYERFKYGLTYYEDLVMPIMANEASDIFNLIKNLILKIDNKCIVDMVGGFRRGKTKGHDLDILVTHPVSGEEKELLKKILEALKSKGHMVYCKHDKEAESDWTKPSSKNIIDHFERFIGILRFHKNEQAEEEAKTKRARLSDELTTHFDDRNDEKLLDEILESANASKYKRDWIARRVDIIVCPIEEHAFALLGWTGSKQFNRSIRLYSEKEFGYRLSSHGIYDHRNDVKIGAKSEKEIFDILKLKYLEPYERNC